MGDEKSLIPMGSRDRERDREMLIPVEGEPADDSDSKPSASISSSHQHHQHQNSGREVSLVYFIPFDAPDFCWIDFTEIGFILSELK